MTKLASFIFLFFSSQLILAQTHTITGVVRDSTGLSVISATIKLTSPKDTLATLSDLDGNFSFRNVKSSQFVISISSLGYANLVKRYLYSAGASTIKLDPITLKSQSNLLKEVIIKGTTPVVVKQDTVEYRASDFPVRENSVAEDVIKKLPGVEVDKDGNVTTQGKSVTRIRVNGKDYFDGDLKTATQGLPADIIEKIQIVDDFGDQANITGIREGEADKIINITIRPDKMKGSVVSGVVGGGNQDRYQVSGNGQFMNNDRQLDARLNINNTNTSPFNFGGGGGRGFGGGGGGNRGGSQGGGNNQSGGNNQGGGGGFGNQGGISNITAGGLNYRDELSKKVSVNGSYRFFVRKNTTLATNLSVSRFDSLGINSTIFNDTENDNNNHSANFNLEYAIDSLNYIRITPYFNISGVKSGGLRNTVQTPFAIEPDYKLKQNRVDQNTISLSNSNTPAYGGNFIYNHRFKKQGRNFSVGLNLNNSDSDNDQDVDDTFTNYNSDQAVSGITDSVRNIETTSERLNANTNITYSEPLGKLGRLDFGYNYALADYKNSRITEVKIGEDFILRNDLSNVYDYSFVTNRFSLNYRFEKPKLYNFTVGISAQPNVLKGSSQLSSVPTRRESFNLFPTARFAYNFARTKALSINYNGRSSEPSFNQIQPVRDVSNPLRPITGNPDLNSAFTQSLEFRYNSTDPSSGLFFNAGMFGNLTNDRITRDQLTYEQITLVTPDTTIARTIQETKYLNADGYYSTNAYYSLGKPFFDKKYRLSLNGNVNFINDVLFVNSRKNTGKNLSFSQNIRLQINPNQNVEIYPAVGYRRTNINFLLDDESDTKASTWNFDLNGKIYFLKTFIAGFDVSKNTNTGYSSIVANPLIINTYLEKQFFNKRGTLRFQGFDLLNEGTLVSISQDANTITNSQTNRLTRYFMATFSFKIQKFGGGVQPDFDRNRGENNRGGGDGQPRGERTGF